MADAYGTLIFSKSEDCSYDEVQLLKTLNRYKWSSCDGSWKLFAGDVEPSFDTGSPQYPTLFVERFDRYLLAKDTGDVWVAASDLAPDDEEYIDDFELSTPDLDQVCKDISGCIKSGWIEIGLAANMRSRYAYFQKLQVFADGRGLRLYCITGYSYPEGISTEFTSDWTSSL